MSITLETIQKDYYEQEKVKAAAFLIEHLPEKGIEPFSEAFHKASSFTVKYYERFRAAIALQCQHEGTTFEDLEARVVALPSQPAQKRKGFFKKAEKTPKASPLEKACSLFLERLPSYCNTPAMFEACYSGCFDLVKTFHANKVPLDCISPHDNASLLHHSLWSKNDDLSVWLVKNGAPFHHATNSNGRTPLHIACLKGHPRVAAALIDAGASLTTRDTIEGNTPLHLACSTNDSKTPEVRARLAFYLLTRGADPRAKNKAGKLPCAYIHAEKLSKGYTIFDETKKRSHPLSTLPRDVRYILYGYLAGYKNTFNNMRLVCKEWNDTRVDDLVFPFRR